MNENKTQPDQNECLSPHAAMLAASTFINTLKQEKRYTEERLKILNDKLTLLEGNPYLQDMANKLFMR